MNINFPPVDAHYIKTMVEDGFYSNATELVRDAVRRLREQADGKYNRLMAALEVGERDLREGRVVPCTQELLDEMERQALADMNAGKTFGPFDPNVCGDE